MQMDPLALDRESSQEVRCYLSKAKVLGGVVWHCYLCVDLSTALDTISYIRAYGACL